MERKGIGHTMTPPTPQPVRGSCLAIVRDKGPNGEADFDDARHWVERGQCDNAAGAATDAEMTVAKLPSDHLDRLYVAATNLADVNDEHAIEPGTIVHLHWDSDKGNKRRYWFTLAAATALLVGGHFNAVGAIPANGLAVWDGTDWANLVSATPDVDGWTVRDAAVYRGQLYVCGVLYLADTRVVGVARWNADSGAWEGLLPGDAAAASGNLEDPQCLVVYGDRLIACGSANGTASCVAAWDGGAWTLLFGPEGACRRMEIYQGLLYVGGGFATCNGAAANGLAAWDGGTWTTVGTGLLLSGASPGATAAALAVHDFDDGLGPMLCIGGHFDEAGAVLVCNNVVRWDGATYRAIGPGLAGSGTVLALCSFGTLEHVSLYAAGDNGIPGSPLMRFDGASWVATGETLTAASGFVNGNALAVFGDHLHVGGGFDSVNERDYAYGVSRVARSLLPEQDKFVEVGTGFNAAVQALAIRAGRLIATGAFTEADGLPVDRLAWHDAAEGKWHALGSLSATGRALALIGGDLYIGGDFTTAAGLNAARLVRLTAAGVFETFGGVNGPVHCLYDDGGKLVIGGRFTLHEGAPFLNVNAIAQYDPATGDWSDFWDAFAHDEGDAIVMGVVRYAGDLYACGRFKFANITSDVVNHIARWDPGTHQWVALGAGLNGEGRCLAVFDGKLIVGGAFSDAGGTAVRNIAAWDGAAWSGLGGLSGQPTAPVDAMVVWDDGGGEDLYIDGIDVGTIFVPGTGLGRVRRWSGAAWTTLADNFAGNILALIHGDAGWGDRLFAGGDYAGTGGGSSFGSPANRVMRFDQDGFTNLGGGVGWVPRPSLGITGGAVYGLRAVDWGDGPRLVVCGGFQVASRVLAESIARLTRRGWKALGRGVRGELNPGVIRLVYDALRHDDGRGRSLHVVGNFNRIVNGDAARATPSPCAGAARFTHERRWEAVGALDDYGTCLIEYPATIATAATLSGTQTITAAAGTFAPNMVGTEVTVIGGSGGNAGTYTITRVIDDTTVEIETEWPGTVADSVTVRIDRPHLYAGGQFSGLVRRWDGTEWRQVGDLPAAGAGAGIVFALARLGDDLFAAGLFSGSSVYRWNGTAWADVSPTGYEGGDLVIADFGTGPALYFGGSKGPSDPAVLRWNGSGWDPLAGLTGQSYRLAVLTGPDTPLATALASIGAGFIGGGPVDVAHWDGTTWTPIGTVGGANNMESLYGARRQGGPLWMGGRLSEVNLARVRELAVWDRTDWAEPGRGGANSGVYFIGQ